MRRLGMGLVGLGFAGARHIDAVRRLGFADVVAVASSSLDSAKKKAREHNIPKAYGSYEELIADPDVHVVHNTTQNYLHTSVNMAAILRRKHIISDKPLGMTSAEARSVWNAAREAGIVHAVLFNYRGNPSVQQARQFIAQGELGPVHFVHGAYLQDWLLEPTDYSWRIELEKGGPSLALADIGSHWADLAQHITGLRIQAVLADLTTVVKVRHRSAAATETFRTPSPGAVQEIPVQGEDLASVLLKFENRAKGCLSVGQVCAGHKNDLWVDVSGSRGSLRWNQERQNELWLGFRHQANRVLAKDPALFDPSIQRYARLPAGHHEGWSDAVLNVIRDIYALILDGKGSDGAESPLVATFEDGYHVNCVVDAMLESHAAGSVWTEVHY